MVVVGCWPLIFIVISKYFFSFSFLKCRLISRKPWETSEELHVQYRYKCGLVQLENMIKLIKRMILVFYSVNKFVLVVVSSPCNI